MPSDSQTGCVVAQKALDGVFCFMEMDCGVAENLKPYSTKWVRGLPAVRLVKGNEPYGVGVWDWSDGRVLIWLCIFTLPAVLVWIKPLWRAMGFSNEKAE